MTNDVFEDLELDMAAEPGPGPAAEQRMRADLQEAMATETASAPGRGRASGLRTAGRRERRRVAVLVAAVLIVLLALFVAPIPRLFRLGTGHEPAPTRRTAGGGAPAVSVARLLAGHWRQMPGDPLAPRTDPVVAWTGRELIVWGGQATDSLAYFSDGASYDPASNSWRPLPPSPLSARGSASGLWTGSELIVFGGELITGSHRRQPQTSDQAAAYDPTTGTWKRLPNPPLSPRDGALSVWTGDEALFLGGYGDDSAYLGDGAAFDPATGRWQHIAAPTPPPHHQVDWQVLVRVGARVLGFADWARSQSLGGGTYHLWGGCDMYSFDPATGAFKLVPNRPNALPAVDDAVFSGRVLLVSSAPYNCGECSHPPTSDVEDLYDPATNTWRRIPTDPAEGFQSPALVWTGVAFISLDAGAPSAGAVLYDPSAGSWRKMPSPPPGCVVGAPPVWTGRQLLVYCASGGYVAHASPSGEVYTPAARASR